MTIETRKRRNEVTLDSQGRIVIPADIRHEKGWEPGERLWLRIIDGRVMILTPVEALRLAREFFQEGLPQGTSMVDELIAERRAAAARGD